VLAKAEAALSNLAEGLDMEEATSRILRDDDSNEDGDDNLDGWVDERTALSDEERQELRETALPVRTVLVKLRKIAFAIINSSTILPPAWRRITVKLKLPDRIMPRDVQTRWNSTYTMLAFAVQYQEAINEITGDRSMNL
ncbi:hypothetical protein BC629DRAFT_1272711, partial [Irpex lacteus]